MNADILFGEGAGYRPEPRMWIKPLGSTYLLQLARMDSDVGKLAIQGLIERECREASRVCGPSWSAKRLFRPNPLKIDQGLLLRVQVKQGYHRWGDWPLASQLNQDFWGIIPCKKRVEILDGHTCV
jgi:hypothetical protein